MTPREMLEPQPPPVGGGPSVTDWLLELLRAYGADPLVVELVRIRREQGIERYGTELTAQNRRNVLCDWIQEAVDLLVYEAQDAIESGDTDVDRELVIRIERAARALLREEP